MARVFVDGLEFISKKISDPNIFPPLRRPASPDSPAHPRLHLTGLHPTSRPFNGSFTSFVPNRLGKAYRRAVVFSSAIFVFYFLPCVLTAYFLVADRFRHTFGNAVLLLASLVFYAWGEAHYFGLLMATVFINYLAGLVLARFEGRPRLMALALGLSANLIILGSYKYAGFVVNSVLSVFIHRETFVPPRLPLGISFFVFQSMSYLIDVYRKEAKVERNPFYLTLYITLFSQLVAGPILRFVDVADQIRNRRHSLAHVAQGASEFVLGLSQKVLIANNVAVAADGVFKVPAQNLSPAAAWFGVSAYALQIYFDFSGYSHMAIGLGRMCGFKFIDNFNFPYASQSITEFWRRWHITLSTWFRDYLYIPLGGNRLGPRRTALNLFIVFFLCGLWHGAAWQFIVWGLFHGALLSIERFGLAQKLARIPPVFRHGYTMVAVLIGWVFFRADDLGQATAFLRSMFGLSHSVDFTYDFARFAQNDILLCCLLGIIGSGPWMMNVVAFCRGKLDSETLLPLWFEFARTITVISLLALSLISIASGSLNPFIYFRF